VRAQVEQNWTAVGSYGRRSTPNLIRDALCVKISSGELRTSSFEGKITGEDLDLLVRYLGSLPSVDESVQK
jgi:hypothetical protein